MLRKGNMLRKFHVYVMTSDYPSICFNYKFLETTKKKEPFRRTKTNIKSL